MSEANRTLEDRMASFDPSDPEALKALEKELMGEEMAEQPAEAEEVAESQEENPATQDVKPETPAAGEPSVAAEPQGVLTKDGKHVIPYNVLERERDRAARAESAAQALTEQLKQLQAAPAGTKPIALTGDVGAFSQEDLENLDQDLPELAKIIRTQIGMIGELTGRVQTLQQEQQIQAQARQQSAMDEIEAAIASNKDLLSWRTAASNAENPDPLMWNRAADLDAVLRQDPAWMDKPTSERFAKVAETINAIYGAPSAPKEQPNAPDLKQIADAKLRAKAAPLPATLSDIPGGAAPAQSDIESLENVSAIALGNKFNSMTPDQIESYLARMVN